MANLHKNKNGQRNDTHTVKSQCEWVDDDDDKSVELNGNSRWVDKVRGELRWVAERRDSRGWLVGCVGNGRDERRILEKVNFCFATFGRDRTIISHVVNWEKEAERRRSDNLSRTQTLQSIVDSERTLLDDPSTVCVRAMSVYETCARVSRRCLAF